MEGKHVLYWKNQAEIIFLNNMSNANLVNLYILFMEKYLKYQRVLKDFDNKTDNQNDKLYAMAYGALTNQCEMLYNSILICHKGNFEEIIQKKVDEMRTIPEYKSFIKEYLLRLLEMNKICDLARLLALLGNVEIKRESKPIIKEYIPKVKTIAAADTTFYNKKGILDGKEMLLLNPENILITVWSSLTLEEQRSALAHELTHIILQPSEAILGVNNNQEQEDKVDAYMEELGIYGASKEQDDKADDPLSNIDTYSSTQEESNEIHSLPELIGKLKKAGFNILKQDDEFVAFCEERNILLYAANTEELIKNHGYHYYYQQPRITYEGDTVISRYPDIENCKEDKIPFPTFTSDFYLDMYNRFDDKGEPFTSSLIRISKYPEIYEAVGLENQKLIDDVLSKANQLQ